MEIVVVNGDISEIRELTDKLMRLKGVEHVNSQLLLMVKNESTEIANMISHH